MDTSPTPPTKYQCLHCAKKYIRISSMEKHKLLCDLEHSSAYQNKIKSQEEEDMPSYRQLVELVKILHLKTISLESKIANISAINISNAANALRAEKKTIPIVQILNDKISPFKTFIDWMNDLSLSLSLSVDINVEEMLDCSFNQIAVKLLSIILNQERDIIYPILCDNKQLYVCTSNGWMEMNVDYLKIFCKKIQDVLILSMSSWRTIHKASLEHDDGKSVLYNNTILNLLEFTKKQTYIKTILPKYVQSIQHFI